MAVCSLKVGVDKQLEVTARSKEVALMPDHERVNGIHLRYLVIETLNIILRGAGISDRKLLLKMYEMVVDEDFPAKLRLVEAQESFFRIKIGNLFELRFVDRDNRVSVHIINNRRSLTIDYDGCHSGQIRARHLVEIAQYFIQYANDLDPKKRSDKTTRQNLEALGISVDS